MNLKTESLHLGQVCTSITKMTLMVLLEMTIAEGKVAYLGVARCNKFIISTIYNLFHFKFHMLPFNMAPYFQRDYVCIISVVKEMSL